MAFSGKRLSSRCLADSSTTAASASGVIVTIWYCSYLGRTYARISRSEEHTSELQSPCNLVCRLLLEKKKTTNQYFINPLYKIHQPHKDKINVNYKRLPPHLLTIPFTFLTTTLIHTLHPHHTHTPHRL